MTLLLDINKFRTAEILDQDNRFNREVQEMALKQIQTWSQDTAEDPSQKTLSPQEQNALDRRIQFIKNLVQEYLQEWYDVPETEERFDYTPRTNVSPLIKSWNDLVIYFKTFINPIFKSYLDTELQDQDFLNQVGDLVSLGERSDFSDLDKLKEFENNVSNGVYQLIKHLYKPSNLAKEEGAERAENLMIKRERTKKRTKKRAEEVLGLDEEDLDWEEEDMAGLLEGEGKPNRALGLITPSKADEAKFMAKFGGNRSVLGEYAPPDALAPTPSGYATSSTYIPPDAKKATIPFFMKGNGKRGGGSAPQRRPDFALAGL